MQSSIPSRSLESRCKRHHRHCLMIRLMPIYVCAALLSLALVLSLERLWQGVLKIFLNIAY